MTKYSQYSASSRLTGDTLALMEEAADHFADDDTLVAAIEIWDNKLSEAAKRLIGTASEHEPWGPLFDYEIMNIVPQAEDGVIGLLRHEQRRRSILAMPSAAFVVDNRSRIVISNQIANDLLGFAIGERLQQSHIDPAFRQTYSAAIQTASNPDAPGRSAILRLGKEDGGHFLFEARIKPDGEAGVIVFRKIGIALTDTGARFLADAFELTESEVGIIKLLMEGLTAKDIADRRKTAEATVRTQLKSIFLKTGTSGQTELMRIVSGISLFQVSRASRPDDRSNFRKESLSAADHLVRTPSGQAVQVNISGAAGGKPFLSLHGLFLGYAFPKIAEDMLRERGLTRHGVMRPGFGASTSAAQGETLGEIVDRFTVVLDELGIKKCPVVAHGFGGAHAFAFAHRHPERVSALILVGAFLPMANMASVMRLSGFQRALMFAAQHSPAMFSFFARTAERVLARDGIVEFLRRYLGSSKADVDVLSLNLTESSIRMRLNLAQAQQIETYRQECLMQISDLSEYATHPGVPVIVIHGAQDPVFPIDLVRKAAEKLGVDQFHELADCGQLILYTKPEIAIAAIAEYA